MSRQISAQHVKRSDLPYIPASEIVVDHSENTRLFKPDFTDLVESFKVDGQLQPCIVRPLADGRVQLVAGYRRWMAAKFIADQQEAEGIAPEDRFKLAVVVQKMSPTEALDRNITENHEREDLSPVEQAHAIRRLRISHGWNDGDGTAKIAKMFRRSVSWVAQTEQLLDLSEVFQRQVHLDHVTDGKQGFSKAVGLILNTVPEDKQEEALAEARSASIVNEKNIPEPSTPTSAKTKVKREGHPRLTVRDITDAAEKHGSTKLKDRTAKDMIEFIDGYFDGSEGNYKLHVITEEFLKRFRGFFTREFDEVRVDNAVQRVDECLKEFWAQHLANKKAKKTS